MGVCVRGGVFVLEGGGVCVSGRGRGCLCEWEGGGGVCVRGGGGEGLGVFMSFVWVVGCFYEFCVGSWVFSLVFVLFDVAIIAINSAMVHETLLHGLETLRG